MTRPMPTRLRRRLAMWIRAALLANEPPACCADCRIEVTPLDPFDEPVAGAWHWYMVRDDVWSAAGMPAHPCPGFLCIPCLEHRLGRELTADDFPPYPVNDPSPLDAPALLAALRRRPRELMLW